MKSLNYINKPSSKKIESNEVEIESDERSDVERFKEAYENAILEGRDTSRSVEDDGFHPSSLGTASGGCMRRAVYLLRGVEKANTFDARVLNIFATGHAVHERIQNYIAKMGVEFQDEIPIRMEDPPITGHADGVLTLPWNNKKILLEIKSTNESGFTARKNWKKGKDEHFAQANIYAYILGIETIWIMYECKDNQEYEIFEHKANARKAENIIKKWSRAYDIFKAGELPERPYRPDHKACMYCDLREHCFADSEVGVSFKPKKETVEEDDTF